jgi:hypothetical protein
MELIEKVRATESVKHIRRQPHAERWSERLDGTPIDPSALGWRRRGR